MKFITDCAQQINDGQFRIEDIRDIAVGGNLLQEAAADGCLASPDFTRQQHEAATAVDAIQQVRERLAVTLAHVNIARVGGDRKWRLGEAEELGIHRRASGIS